MKNSLYKLIFISFHVKLTIQALFIECKLFVLKLTEDKGILKFKFSDLFLDSNLDLISWVYMCTEHSKIVVYEYLFLEKLS